MNKIIAVIIAALEAIAFASSPTVTDVTAKQRYPWNGLVDITCKVSGINGTTNGLKFAVAAVMPDTGNVRKVSQFWLMQGGTISTDREVHTNGNYRLLWDARLELGQVVYSNMVVRVNVDDLHGKVQLWEGGPYWATTNIGAEEPWEYGYYFWWGDTVGYKRQGDAWVATDGSSSNYSFGSRNSPTYNKSIDELKSAGWIITEANVLAPEHDAARVQWGTGWRMPRRQELEDLYYNCSWTWTVTNGVKGFVVRGKRSGYESCSIFLPAAGYSNGTSHYNVDLGYYWSSVPGSDYYSALGLCFDSRGVYAAYGEPNAVRYLGRFVRPVQGDLESYIVTYLPGTNGSGTQQTAIKSHDVALVLKGAIFMRNGYKQTGWATNDGGGKVYDLGTPYVVNAGITLYPFWTAATYDKVQLWAGGPYWAETNIGAEVPWESGNFFWWGDTVGYKRENDTWCASDGSESNFSFSWGNTPTGFKDISMLQSEGWITAQGYINVVYMLAAKHDAAQVQLGGGWRMPTYEEFRNLNSRCDWTWTRINGRNGYIICGSGDFASASIFLPCAGYGDGTVLGETDFRGYYRSSTPADNDYNSWQFVFGSSYHSTSSSSRYLGESIRPVQGSGK